MTWADVEWTSGDTVTETKLDTMQANLDHLREEIRYKALAYDGKTAAITGAVTGGTPGASSQIRYRVNPYGSLSAGDTLISAGSFNDASSWNDETVSAIDVSGADDGPNSVELVAEWRETGASSWITFKRLGGFVYVKTPDINRLTIEVRWVGFYNHSFTYWSQIYGTATQTGKITIIAAHVGVRGYRA